MWVKFGIFVLGGWLGSTFGMMIYNAFVSILIGDGTHAETCFIIFMSIFALGGGILCCTIYNHAMAIASSLVGAYALVRVRIILTYPLIRVSEFFLEISQMNY